jgi:hypothetical protein
MQRLHYDKPKAIKNQGGMETDSDVISKEKD